MGNYSVELSLTPECQMFISCSCTWAAAYFLTSEGSVVRCSLTEKDGTTVHVFSLKTGEWKKNDPLVTEVIRSLLPAHSPFPHLGSFIVPVGNTPAEVDSRFLLASTDQRVYLVKEEEEESCLYLIDSPKFDSILHITMDIPQGGKIVRALAGYAFVVLLDSAGRLYSFGCGTRGELGHGSLESRTEPSLLQYFDAVKVVDIAVGGWHTLALTDIGAVYAWGWNESGQLGLNQKQVADLPTEVGIPEESKAVAVACGSRHSLILAEENRLYAFGCNDYGQIDFNSCLVERLKNGQDNMRLVISDRGDIYSSSEMICSCRIIEPQWEAQSPIFAEIFMERLEGEALTNQPSAAAPRLFKRRVDDIFAAVETGHISFATEKDPGNRLLFFDALVNASAGRLKTTVYFEATQSERYVRVTAQ